MRPFLLCLFTVIIVINISCSEIKSESSTTSVSTDSIVNAPSRVITLQMISPLDSCSCDTNSVKQLVLQKSYNSLSKYDAPSFKQKKFYDLDSAINRMLWFRDVENPTPTKFTELWDAYWFQNYHANPTDFLNYYLDKSDVPMAFILGPNHDLWAYHILVIKKVQCCYLMTRSYYRHNRFTYKAFSVFDKYMLDGLYSALNKTNLSKIDTSKINGYAGYFVDNTGKNRFTIDFENEVVSTKDSTGNSIQKPKKEILDFYEFLDKKIHWTKTY